jgi:hypothetical protein
MPRNYSEKFLLSINKMDTDRLGVQLGQACVKANLPALYIAEALNVSRMTIHSWFRGKPLRDKNAQKVKSLLQNIDEDLSKGTLPAPSMPIAKKYIQNIVGLQSPNANVS